MIQGLLVCRQALTVAGFGKPEPEPNAKPLKLFCNRLVGFTPGYALSGDMHGSSTLDVARTLQIRSLSGWWVMWSPAIFWYNFPRSLV